MALTGVNACAQETATRIGTLLPLSPPGQPQEKARGWTSSLATGSSRVSLMGTEKGAKWAQRSGRQVRTSGPRASSTAERPHRPPQTNHHQGLGLSFKIQIPWPHPHLRYSNLVGPWDVSQDSFLKIGALGDF